MQWSQRGTGPRLPSVLASELGPEHSADHSGSGSRKRGPRIIATARKLQRKADRQSKKQKRGNHVRSSYNEPAQQVVLTAAPNPNPPKKKKPQPARVIPPSQEPSRFNELLSGGDMDKSSLLSAIALEEAEQRRILKRLKVCMYIRIRSQTAI